MFVITITQYLDLVFLTLMQYLDLIYHHTDEIPWPCLSSHLHNICFHHAHTISGHDLSWQWYNIWTLFIITFTQYLDLQARILLKGIDSGYLVCNSSYSYMPILLKLYRCFCHGLEMCSGLGIIPEYFLWLFLHFKLSHFSGVNTIKVYIYWVLCVHNTSNSFIPTFLKLYRCFCHGLKMCMWFGYNPEIKFCQFLLHFEHIHFSVLNTIKVKI